MNEYSSVFSKIYNEMGWNYYPTYFAEQLLRWMTNHQVRVQSSLDLGCGTGVLCELLKDLGIDAEGMDLSDNMIQIARERAPHIRFEVANMITFDPGRSYDLVTSTCDAINHIHDIRDVETIFRKVYGYLNPGGYFIFDLLDENEKVDQVPFSFDLEDGQHVRIQTVLTPGHGIEMHVMCLEDEKIVWEEVISEKLYPDYKILELLKKAGFAECRCVDSLLADEGQHGTALYFIARK